MEDQTFKTFRYREGAMSLYVAGEPAISTDALDRRSWRNDWSSAEESALLFSFGNRCPWIRGTYVLRTDLP